MKMTIDEVERYSKVYIKMLGIGKSTNELKILGGQSIMTEAKKKIFFANLVNMLIESNKDKDKADILDAVNTTLTKTAYSNDKYALYNTLQNNFNCHSSNSFEDAKFKLICEQVQKDAHECIAENAK